MLAAFARDVPRFEHAAIYPEDEFEARLVHDAPVRRFVARETRAEHDRRLRYLYETVDVHRNMVLVCPNHHSAIHRDDAAFDFMDHAFQFSNGLRERLAVNDHLPAAEPAAIN